MKNGAKNIQAAAYNGTHTLFVVVFYRQAQLKQSKQIFEIRNLTRPNRWATKNICFRLSNFCLDMVNLSLMKVVISAFSVVSKDSEDSSFKLIDVVVSISSVVSLVAHHFGRVEFRIPYTGHYNPFLIRNCL